MRLGVVLLFLTAASLGRTQKDLRALLLGEQSERSATFLSDPRRYAPLVTPFLGDRTHLVRRRAARALAEMDLAQEDADRKLHSTLSDEQEREDEVRRATVVAALAKASGDRDPDVRNEAIRSLVTVLRQRDWGRHGEIRGGERHLRPLRKLGPAAFPVLLEVLRNDGNYASRVSALRVLAHGRSAKILDGLLGAIDKESRVLVAFAMRAALRYEDSRVIQTILKNIDKGIPDYSGTMGERALEHVKSHAVPELIHQLKSNPDAKLRSLAISGLNSLVDVRVSGPLIEALADPLPDVRAAAAYTLASYPDAPSRPALMAAAVDDPTVMVRECALRALGALRYGPAYDVVSQALDQPSLTQTAIVSLARIDGRRAVPRLLPLATQKDLRLSVAQAFRIVRDPRTASTLITIFEEESGDAAEEAAMALAEMGARESIPLLVLSLDSEKGYRAAYALAAFGREATNAVLDFSAQAVNKVNVVYALGDTQDPRVIEFLLAELDRTAQDSAAIAAIEKLGEAGERRVIGALIRQLASVDEYVAQAAAEALGKLEAIEAVEPLVSALNRWEDPSDAASALARIGDRRALEPLLGFIRHNDPTTWKF